MAHLIDKDALVAEIEKKLCNYKTALENTSYMTGQYVGLKARIALCEELLETAKTIPKESVSEDLEDALKAKVDEELKDPVLGKLINTFAAYAFAKQIVNWHKEQMMKDAIDATIDIIYTPKTWLPEIVFDGDQLRDLCKDKFEQDDKVKVIIIKE